MQPKKNSLPVDNAQHDDGKRRVLAIPGVEKGKHFAWLSFKDEVDGKYRLPLGKITSYAKHTEKPVWDTVVIPVFPLRYTTTSTSEKTNRAKAYILRKGWIYIYKDGYLWRELQVINHTHYRDVNLSRYQGHNVRHANGERDNYILVPHKVDGKIQKLQICFSEVQWGWDRINALGGMDPADPRLHKDTPMPTGGSTSPATLRKQRMGDVLDFSSHTNGFNVHTGPIGPIDETTVWAGKLLHGTGTAALYLHDTLGIVRALKKSHLHRAYAAEAFVQYMVQADAPYAKLLKSLIKNEDENAKNDKATRIAKEHLKDVNSGTYPFYETYAIDMNVDEEDVKHDAEEQVKDAISKAHPIASVINQTLLEQRLKYWKDNDKKYRQSTHDAAMALLQAIKISSEPFNFECMILDYLLGNVPARAMQGAAFWTDLLTYIDSKVVVDYIKSVSAQTDPCSLGHCLKNPTKGMQRVAEALEKGDREALDRAVEHASEKEGFTLKREDIKVIFDTSTGVIDRLVKTFAKGHLVDGSKGLDPLAKLIEAYLPKFKAIIESFEVSVFYRSKKLAANLFAWMPSRVSDIAKTKVKAITLLINTEKIGAAKEKLQKLSESDTYTLGFSGLLALVNLINTSMAYNEIAEKPGVTNAEKLSLIASAAELLKSTAEFAKEYCEKAEEMWKMSEEGFVKSGSIDTDTRSNAGKNLGDKSTNVNSKAQQEIDRLAAGHVERFGRIGGIAGTVATNMEILGATIGYVVAGKDMYEQMSEGSPLGILGAGFELTGTTIMSLTSITKVVRFFQGIVTTAEGVEVAGAATSEAGVGIPLFIAGAILSLVGSKCVEIASQPAYLKTIQYGYFGIDRTGFLARFEKVGGGFWDNLLARKIRYEPKDLPTRLQKSQLQGYDTHAQLAVIYAAMFDFDACVDMVQLSDGSYALRGVVTPGAFIAGSSTLDVVITTQTQNHVDELLLIRPKLKVLPVVKNEVLQSVKYFYRLTKEQKKQITRVMMTVSMDINGDNQYRIPNKDERKYAFNIDDASDYNDIGLAPTFLYQYKGGSKDGDLTGDMPTQAISDVQQAK